MRNTQKNQELALNICLKPDLFTPKKGRLIFFQGIRTVEIAYTKKRVSGRKDWRAKPHESAATNSGRLENSSAVHYDQSYPKGANKPLSSTILPRIASGDSGAVQECLDRYGGLVWSLAKRFLPDPQEAEDAVQEIFIELWKKAHLFDANLSSEKTFVAMLTRRRLIDRLRKNYRKPTIESIETSMELHDDSLLGSDKRLDAQRALQMFKMLKPEQQKCLRLSIIAGMSHSEISEAVSLPIGTVKSHIRRGLIAVREKLGGASPNVLSGGVS